MNLVDARSQRPCHGLVKRPQCAWLRQTRGLAGASIPNHVALLGESMVMAFARKTGSPMDHKLADRVTILSALQEILSLGNDLETPYG
jgi:hypothetical protein